MFSECSIKCKGHNEGCDPHMQVIVTICLHLGAALSMELVISFPSRVLCIIDTSFGCSEAICSVLLQNCCMGKNFFKTVSLTSSTALETTVFCFLNCLYALEKACP